jgi:excinuclease UvrABC nuclease subunit
MQTLQRVFKFRTCELDIRSDNPANRRFRPCLLHAIDQCTAPCANRITPEAYRADIERFIRFLGSKRSAMLREMRAEMEQASATQEYEKAASLRDQIGALEKLSERETRGGDAEYDWQPEVTSLVQDPAAGLRSIQRTLGLAHAVRCIEAIDIAHLGGSETVGSKVAFIDGRPFKDGYRRFRIRTVANDDYSAIREVVSRRYREAGEGQELYPDLILIDGGIGQLRAAMEAFAQLDRQPPAAEPDLDDGPRRADQARPRECRAEAVPVDPRRGAPLRAALPPPAAHQAHARAGPGRGVIRRTRPAIGPRRSRSGQAGRDPRSRLMPVSAPGRRGPRRLSLMCRR